MATEQDAFEARCLFRGARIAALATADGGRPHASLVTPAVTAAGDVLLLLSGLSSHTRALAGAPACALMTTGAARDANPQTAPRVTLHGRAERLARGTAEEAAARARYLAVHPYAGFYAELGDFAIWRIRPEDASFVGGFGRARKLATASLRPDPDFAAAIDAAMPDLLAAGGAGLVSGGGRIVGIDPDGIDRVEGDATRHHPFDAAVSDLASLRAALERLVA